MTDVPSNEPENRAEEEPELNWEGGLFVLPFAAEQLPDWIDRFAAASAEFEGEDEVLFEGMELQGMSGIWVTAVGGYDRDEDPAPLTIPADPPAPGTLPGLAWNAAQRTRDALVAAWGEPHLRTLQLGENGQPEGVLDVLLSKLGADHTQLWDRGDFSIALMMQWAGEPSASDLQQYLIVMPQDYAYGGLMALKGVDTGRYPLLMNGEHPLELHRRAWVESQAQGFGECTLPGALRYGHHTTTGTAAQWTFCDDGRIMVAFFDPESDFFSEAAQALQEALTEADGEFDAGDPGDPASPGGGTPDDDTENGGALREREARLMLVRQVLEGLPRDLRALLTEPGTAEDGLPADHVLDMAVLDGELLPWITGVVWFDGEAWCYPSGALALVVRHGRGVAELGLGAAVSVPYFLGGEYTLEIYTRVLDEVPPALERAFEECPYPEQPRPDAQSRLGMGAPPPDSFASLIEDIERASSAWWDRSPEDAEWDDKTFTVGRESLQDRDGQELWTVLAEAQPWTYDALIEWAKILGARMNERWGAPSGFEPDEFGNATRRTALGRVVLGSGVDWAPVWNVDGHAVSLIVTTPSATNSDQPIAILEICSADALTDPLMCPPFWQLRGTLRALSVLSGTPLDEIDWEGAPIKTTELLPRAERGSFRSGERTWVWCMTHRGTGLLMSVSPALTAAEGGAPSPRSFEEQLAMFDGVPDDLFSLAANQDPRGLYEVITREAPGTEPGARGRAESLPRVDAVIYRAPGNWRVSEGMLRPLRHIEPGTTLRQALFAPNHGGLVALQWALRPVEGLRRADATDPLYMAHVLDVEPSPAVLDAAFPGPQALYAAALRGGFNEVLDHLAQCLDARTLLDAALSHTDLDQRTLICWWLLADRRENPGLQIGGRTAINVLLGNATLHREDRALLEELLRRGASSGAGLLGPDYGVHPLEQLLQSSLSDADAGFLAEPLLAAVAARGSGEVPALLERLRDRAWPPERPRHELLARLRAMAPPAAS